MKKASSHRAILALSGAFCSVSLASTLTQAGQPAPPVYQTAPARWSVTVGATARTIEADFRVSAPAYKPGGLGMRGGPVNQLPLLGNPGLGSDSEINTGTTVSYSNGTVGPVFYGFAGDWNVEFASLSQLTPSGRSYVYSDGSTTAIYDLNFTSDGGARRTTYTRSAFTDLAGSDSETAIGPTVSLNYNLFSGPNHKISAGLSYSFLPASLGIRGGMGGLDVFRKTEKFTHHYRYDTVDFDADGIDNDLLAGTNLPYAWYVIGDPNIAYTSSFYDLAPGQENPFLPPSYRRSSSSSTKRVAVYTAAGFADLDVDLHEVALTGSLLFPIGDRLAVGLTAGPTLNIVDSDFTAGINIYRAGKSEPVAKLRQHTSDTEVALGAMLDLVVNYNLTSDGRWFAQLQGGYRWVEDVEVKTGGASADLDLSDFAGTASLGFNF